MRRLTNNWPVKGGTWLGEICISMNAHNEATERDSLSDGLFDYIFHQNQQSKQILITWMEINIRKWFIRIDRLIDQVGHGLVSSFSWFNILISFVCVCVCVCVG